jgi:hypothetical protein
MRVRDVIDTRLFFAVQMVAFAVLLVSCGWSASILYALATIMGVMVSISQATCSGSLPVRYGEMYAIGFLATSMGVIVCMLLGSVVMRAVSQ